MAEADIVGALVSLSEASEYLRLDEGNDEALVAGLIRTASALCEEFVGEAILLRPFRERRPATGDWQQLRSRPARSITSVTAFDVRGTGMALESGKYLADIDAEGRGWVRLLSAGSIAQIEVVGTCGSAADVNQVPEPLRQGVLRLVAHLYANRDGPGGEPPAAVTALWRPYRRLVLR